MTFEMPTSVLGRTLIKDDPVLLRLLVKTELQPHGEFQEQMQERYPAYHITYEPIEKAYLDAKPIITIRLKDFIT